MNTTEQVRKLRKLGLSRYEAAAYAALLGEEGITPGKAARKGGIPQPRIYGALNTLVERGFAEVTLDEPKTYRAVPPTLAFARHRQRAERAMQESMDEIAGEMTDLERHAPAPTEDPTAFGIRLVRGASQAERLFVGTYESAQNEILLFVKAPLFYPPVLDNDRELSRRGVQIKWLIERPILDDPAIAAGYQEFARCCGEVRVRESLPVKLAVFDGRLVGLPLSDKDATPTLLMIPNSGLAANMREWFMDVWDRAEPLKAGRKSRQRG
jgi:sugar-specific transcriptional regulator TrmB